MVSPATKRRTTSRVTGADVTARLIERRRDAQRSTCRSAAEGLAPADVEDVVVGTVSETGEQGGCIARMAVLAAGWPNEATGVSLNRGVTGMTLEAVNYGYRVVIPTDCVVGYPKEYGDMMLEHTLAPLAWLSTAEAIMAAWR